MIRRLVRVKIDHPARRHSFERAALVAGRKNGTRQEHQSISIISNDVYIYWWSG